jgi:hypothetical protein
MKDVNELIRAEMAAVKSIDAILGKLNEQSGKKELTSIRSNHVHAVDSLKRFASNSFKETSESSGPWEAFAASFTRGASLFGNKAAMRALKLGEEYGISKYKAALKEEGIDIAIRDLIRSQLLPQQEGHLNVINRYLQ